MSSIQPWAQAMSLWRQRFRQARLGQAAGSLTFTTLMALVPLLTVMLAVFAAFPVFSSLQEAVEKMFLQSLVPDTIAKPVLKAMTQFASKASRLGVAGLLVLLLAVLALMLTIDRTLNAVWQVRRPKPLSQRLLIYALGMTLGPLAVGLSFTATSYAFSMSHGWSPYMPAIHSTLVDALQWAVVVLGSAGLYRFLPNTPVRSRDALLGGVFVGVSVGVARAVLGWYVSWAPTYASVYGAFATLPILLLWIYIVWVLVLCGAVLAASAPAAWGQAPAVALGAGHRFTLALQALRELAQARDTPQPTIDPLALAHRLGVDPLDLRPVLNRLTEWGWLAWIDGDGPVAAGVMLRLHPAQCPLAPLEDTWLLTPHPATAAWRQRQPAGLTLAELL